MRDNKAYLCRALMSFALGVTVALTAAPPSQAQKNKKKKDDSVAEKPITMMPDEQQIDYMISTMMGAWQLNDVDKMHQCYADEATFVSGTWGPLIIGWANYLPLYQQQRARTTQVRLERTNTYTRVVGTLAWSSYQWDFSGTVDGRAMTSQGQTTLVMEKRNNHWLIVHNHTSVAQVPQALPGAPDNTSPPAQAPPAKPPSQ